MLWTTPVLIDVETSKDDRSRRMHVRAFITWCCSYLVISITKVQVYKKLYIPIVSLICLLPLKWMSCWIIIVHSIAVICICICSAQHAPNMAVYGVSTTPFAWHRSAEYRISLDLRNQCDILMCAWHSYINPLLFNAVHVIVLFSAYSLV